MPRFTHTPAARSRRTAALIAATIAVSGAFAALLLTAVSSRAANAIRHDTVACNENDRGDIWPVTARTGVRQELVPPGAVSLSICGYNGMNATSAAPQFGLTGSGDSSGSKLVGRIVAELDALKPASGVSSCPDDTVTDDDLTFSYRTGPPVVVTLDTTGCNPLSNHHVQRLAMGASVLSRIEALTKPTAPLRWATVTGHLRLCGGPAPGRCYIENFDGNDRVVVHGAGQSWLAMAQIVHGRFHFRLAGAGTYTFDFYAGNKLIAHKQARAKAAGTTSVVFPISIP